MLHTISIAFFPVKQTLGLPFTVLITWHQFKTPVPPAACRRDAGHPGDTSPPSVFPESWEGLGCWIIISGADALAATSTSAHGVMDIFRRLRNLFQDIYFLIESSQHRNRHSRRVHMASFIYWMSIPHASAGKPPRKIWARPFPIPFPLLWMNPQLFGMPEVSASLHSGSTWHPCLSGSAVRCLPY